MISTSFGPLKIELRPVFNKTWEGVITSMLDCAIIWGPNENTKFILYEDGYRVIEYLHDLYARGELHPIPGSDAADTHALAMQCGFDEKKFVTALANKLQHGEHFPDPKKMAALAMLEKIEPSPPKVSMSEIARQLREGDVA